MSSKQQRGPSVTVLEQEPETNPALLQSVLEQTKKTTLPDVGGSIKPNYIKTVLPAGKVKYIHVIPEAIRDNLKFASGGYPDYYPTCIVVDERGQHTQYHAVVVRGDIALRAEFGKKPLGITASVFVETYAEVEVYTNPDGASEYAPRRGCG